MELDYSKIFSYQYFLDKYAPIIDSEDYDLILKQSKQLLNIMAQKLLSRPQNMVAFINDYFRNDPRTYRKHIAMIHCLYNDDLIYKVFKNYDMNIDDFIGKVNNGIILSRIAKFETSNNDHQKINDIFSTIGKYHGYQNNALITLKIYEMKYKTHALDDKQKTK